MCNHRPAWNKIFTTCHPSQLYEKKQLFAFLLSNVWLKYFTVMCITFSFRLPNKIQILGILVWCDRQDPCFVVSFLWWPNRRTIFYHTGLITLVSPSLARLKNSFCCPPWIQTLKQLGGVYFRQQWATLGLSTKPQWRFCFGSLFNVQPSHINICKQIHFVKRNKSISDTIL